MSEPFIGEIRMFAGNFAPVGWAHCDGQLLSIAQNTALFSLFGTVYGGDGKTTLALPDMRGRVPIHAGSGPGLTPRPVGQKGGVETVALATSELPSHSHALGATSQAATVREPVGASLADTRAGLYGDAPLDVELHALSLLAAGGGAPHDNIQPYLVVTFIVALMGIYPSMSNF